jgi:hypothetical protein
MDRHPTLPPSPAPSSASDRETASAGSMRQFALYAMPSFETAASLAARRALMSRKSLSVEEAGARARERRRAAGRIQRFDRLARLLLLLLVAAGGIAWLGSAWESIPVLLAGYLLLGVATVALIARLTRTPRASRLPLERYYLLEEQLASAEDIVLLRRLAQEDRELDAATTAWWRSSAPIRKGDVRLAVDFAHARRATSGITQEG